MAAIKRGLKRGLFSKQRTVIVMLDETIITETPPLCNAYCRIGMQECVPITGNRQKRILHGALNIKSGNILLLITKVWDEVTHQYFLERMRSKWKGWHIVLLEDRGTPHKAEESLILASVLDIEVRLLPRATPELNAMDQLWRHVKGRALANRRTIAIDESADKACRYLLDMSPKERLQKAGVLSENFWLAN
jgi:hypothetical protein